MTKTNETMGMRIRRLRKERQMTQENLAEIMYVKHGLISQYENDVIMPSVDRLQEISKHLDTTVGYLVDGIESTVTKEDSEILAALHSIQNGAIRNSLIEHIKQLALM